MECEPDGVGRTVLNRPNWPYPMMDTTSGSWKSIGMIGYEFHVEDRDEVRSEGVEKI